MADQMTMDEFGAKVKEKYPAYANLSNTEIANKIIAKYPQYKSSIKQASNAPQPLERTPGNYAAEVASGVGRGLMNDVTGIATTIAHPIDTAKGMVKQLSTAQQESQKEYNDLSTAGPFTRNLAAMLTFAENSPIIGGMVQHAEQGGTTPVSPESVGAAAEGVTTLEAPKIAGEVVGPMTRVLRNIPETMRKGTQTVLGAGEKAVKSNISKEAESAANAADTVKKANKTADERTLEERGKIDEKNKAIAEKDRQERLETIRKNREADIAHAAEKSRINETNREAIRQQEKIAPTQGKLESASSELRGRVETARETALKEGNKKYTPVNEELNPVPADMEKVHKLYQDASGSIGEAQSEPPILKRLGTSLERGDALSYKDMQGMYSELGKELSKGTLPGSTYHAYDLLHEGLGEDMQRIADSKGMGDQLTDARNYWRRMKQTFGKPLTMGDNATAAVKGANPDFVPEDTQANRLRLLGSFDPEIPKVVEHITNLRRGMEALPKESPLREITKVPPARPEPTPIPKPSTPADYAEPHATKPIEIPEVNTQEIRQKLIDRWTSGETTTNKYQVHRLLTGGLGSIVGFALGESAGGLGRLGAEVGGAVSYTFGPAAIAKLVESPTVREWLTRPPVDELETLRQLPNADRIKIVDGLTRVANAAQKQGVQVSPAITSVIALSKPSPEGSKTKYLRELRDKGAYTDSSNPNQ